MNADRRWTSLLIIGLVLGLALSGCAPAAPGGVAEAPPPAAVEQAGEPAPAAAGAVEAPPVSEVAEAPAAAPEAAMAEEVVEAAAEPSLSIAMAPPPDVAASEVAAAPAEESVAVVMAPPPDVAAVVAAPMAPPPDVAAVEAAPEPEIVQVPVFSDGTVLLDGFVINHREAPVDGTRTSPPLVVYADDGAGTIREATVGPDGFFEFTDLPLGRWNFALPLPADWDAIIPQAGRGGLAETGFTPLEHRNRHYRIVLKIRRLVDVPVLKWEELADGSVQPGEGWAIRAAPQGDPFVKAVGGQTGPDGAAVFTLTPGTWTFSEAVKPGWTPVTPAQVVLHLDQYAPPPVEPVVFKNRLRP